MAIIVGVLAPTVTLAMDVTSASIKNGTLNTLSACEDLGGEDVSPQLTISNAPEGTTHFAIVMDDPDAKALDGKTWVHWNVVNILAQNMAFDADESPPGEALENDNEDEGYGGMCPTDGRHTYRIAVFALGAPIDTDADTTPAALTVEAMTETYANQILDTAIVKGAFP